eukprot:TRINITY_DN12744_c0_g1_i1.p1 TRINITY_DN12744_c0_g1~~TRINITY_DN12744_c0_g1_i1.p1  ORF type:complete len:287 (-),score=57.10 TRINITY_DN12744_c0_g1_i1:24-884(-)
MELVRLNFVVSVFAFLMSLFNLHMSSFQDYVQVHHCGIPKKRIPLELQYIIGNYTGRSGSKKLARYVEERVLFKDKWPLYSFEDIFPYRRIDGTYDFIYIRGKNAWRFSCPLKRLDMNQTGFACYDVRVPDPSNETQFTERIYSEFDCMGHIQSRKHLISSRRWTEIRRWGTIYFHLPLDGVKGKEDLLDEEEAGPYAKYYGNYRIITRALRETLALAWIKASFNRNFFPRTWPETLQNFQDRMNDFRDMLGYHFLFYACVPDWDIGDLLYCWIPDFQFEFLFNLG